MDESQTVRVGDRRADRPAWTSPPDFVPTEEQFALALAFMGAVAVLLLAAYLRLTSLDLIQFTRHEVAQLRLSSQWLQQAGIEIPQTDGGAGASPVAVYLLALPLVVSGDPLLAAGFVALLNVAAVAVGYLLARRYFGEGVALISALLYAVAPWAVIFARGLDAAAFLPLFAALFFYALFATFIERRSWFLVLAGFWLGVLLQVHPASASFLPVFVLALIIYWRRLKSLPFIVSLIALGLTLWPSLSYAAAHGWSSLRMLVPGGGPGAELDLASIQYGLQIATGAGLQHLAGQGMWRFQAGRLALGWLDLMEQALIVLGIIHLFVAIIADGVRAWGRPTPSRAVGYSLVLLWFLVPVVVNVRHRPDLAPIHLSLLYPSQFLIVGIFLASLARSVARLLDKRRPAHEPGLLALAAGYTLPLAAVAAVALWQFQSTGALQAFLERNTTEGGYGTPIKYPLEVTNRTRELSRALDNQRVMVLTGNLDLSESDLLAALDYLFGADIQPKYVDARQEAFVFPASQERDSLYLVLPGDGLARSVLEIYAEELEDQAVVLPGGESVIRFYRLPPAEDALPQVAPGMPVSMGDGLSLLRIEAPSVTEPGSTLPVTLTWRIEEVSPESLGYSLFNQLVDDWGQKWAQDDGTGYSPYQWEAGETVVSWYRLQVPPEAPPGRCWLISGMYRISDLQRLPLVGPDGQELGKELRLGPIKVARPRAVWEAEAVAMEHEAKADLAGKVTLLGYDLSDRFPQPGDRLRLVLYWQAQTTMERDYTVFAHLLDGEGRLRAQHDGQPQAGRYPTSIWAPGEIVRDAFDIVIPEDMPVGTYELRVGMYDLATMERLEVREGPPGVMDNSILLAEVVVVP